MRRRRSPEQVSARRSPELPGQVSDGTHGFRGSDPDLDEDDLGAYTSDDYEDEI